MSLKSLRKILGLEDIRDEFGNVVQEAPLEIGPTSSSGHWIMPLTRSMHTVTSN